MKRIAFLCTGDELVNGDILDTNGQYFAQQLLDHGMHPGRKVTVSDSQAEIEAAMHYLLSDHDALIMTGGLGPTSDDRTRFALADFLEQPLVMNQAAWEWIVQLISSKNLAMPENNRQQALLPEGAKLIHNAFGTAAACHTQYKGKDIFTLPGPPNECQPIFDKSVMPELIQGGYSTPVFRKKCLLLGVSEGVIAEMLDPLVINTSCFIGYRFHYPYLEVKLWSTKQLEIEKMAQQFKALLGDKTISQDNQKASEKLIAWLSQTHHSLSIDDQVTRGRLAAELIRPETYQKIDFQAHTADIQIALSGLEAYWENTAAEHEKLSFTISITSNDLTHEICGHIPYRKEKTLDYAVEFICWKLIQFFNSST